MVSCLMGDSTALASAIVRCCPNNIPIQLDFLGDEEQRMKIERLENTIDDLRRRFGQQIIRRAVVVTDEQYARVNPVQDHTIHPVPFYGG